MITKNHPSAYAELFKKAQDVLSKHGGKQYEDIKISNIDDYFGCLKDLAAIEIASEKGEIDEVIDPIFTILPATEETFNINANTRIISIPDNFAKYGVGVQGDEIAEILYFSIDRYFDAMDLADMDIIVQWKHSSDNDLVSNLSATYKKSLTLQPGKIVFGWPITSEVTERSGNINFSIRFYRREENALIYSFSTLPATIKIQAGLDFSLTLEDTQLAIKKNEQIYKNLRNSIPADIDYIIAAPVFEARWIQEEGSDELIPASADPYDNLITLATKAGFLENSEGEISNNGISYSWYRNDSLEELKGQDAYKIANINDFNSKEIYYILNNGVYEPYYLDGNPFDDEDIGDIYVKYNKFTPTIAGSYYAKATNNYTYNNFKSVISDRWVIAGADNPIFTYGNEDRAMVLEDNPSILIAVEPSNGNIIENDKWYLSDNAIFDNTAKVIQGASGNNYNATEEGYYYREVTYTKNGDNKTSISSPVWTRHAPSDPMIIADSGNQSEEIYVIVQAPQYGTITYQWQTIDGVDIDGATNNSYKGLKDKMYKCVVTNTYKGNEKSITSNALGITG